MNIKLSDEQKIKILNADQLYGVMQQILRREDYIDQDREHFWIVGLNTKNRILFIELISLGTVKSALAEPMDVFSFALQKRASNIILVHNHPSGELFPSEEDEDLTDRMIQVGIIVDTMVLDHLIITPTTFMSFAEEGLMDLLAKSTKYVPNYVLYERIKKEAEALGRKLGREEGEKLGREEGEKLGREEGAHERSVEIAMNMKREGAAPDMISRITGLSQEEIASL